jgi:hypothetical protein
LRRTGKAFLQIILSNYLFAKMSVLNQVRESCASYHSSLAWCDFDEADGFASKINPSEILSFIHSDKGLSTNRFDKEVPFPTSQDEIGFVLVAHGLDFGSGFRKVLHEHRNGSGAWLTIRAGLVKMGQANPSMNSLWLSEITKEQVEDFFDLHHSCLFPLVQQLHTSIHEIGEELLKLGYQTPGEFVMAKMTSSASKAVEALIDTFPLTFLDEYCLCYQRVAFYKKAQLVVSEMNMLFASRYPEQFAYSDVNELTAFVDNVVVAMMRMNQIVKTTSSLALHIKEGKEIIKGSEEEIALRAAALTGVERIVQTLKKLRNEKKTERVTDNKQISETNQETAVVEDDEEEINAQKLCNWLWGCLGKTGENRKYVRHLSPSTSFY